MATIDYKEKYEQALAKAKDMLNYKEVRQEDMEYLFPELKKSEDERIKRVIKQVLYESTTEKDECYLDNGVTQQEVFAWLEKQGKNNMGISEATKQKLEDNLNKALEKETPESWNEFLDEQKQELLTKEKALKNSPFVEQKPSWSEEDEAIYYGVIETEQYMLDVVNGIKKFNVGNISIKEECTRELNWLKSLKERVLPQPKQEWSDIDKDILFRTIDNLKFLRDTISIDPKYAVNIIDIEREITWLNSLRPQKHWKPSDEQIKGIECAIKTLQHQLNIGDKRLNSLYYDLKKLREE